MKRSLLIAICALTSFGATMADVTLEVVEKAPPAELSDAIKPLLDGKAYIVSNGDGVLYEFWFVKEISAGKATEDAKATLESIPGMALLGAVTVPVKEHSIDFRDDAVDPGAYTVRMGIQPTDGNHLGTAPTNFFALMVPAAKDTKVEGFGDHDEMVEVAQEGTVAEHPPILYMQPETTPGEYPRIGDGNWNKLQWKLLCLKLPVKAGDAKGSLKFNIVVEGHGEV